MQTMEKQATEMGLEKRLDMAHNFIAGGAIDKAEETLRDLIKDYPNHAESYTVLCNLYLAMERADLPKEWILNALRHDESLAAPLLQFSSYLYMENQLSECDKILEALVWANPDNYEAWNDLGVVRFAMEDLVTAEKAFHQALALNPFYGESIVNLAGLHLATSRYELAVQTALKVLEEGVRITPECLQELAVLISKVAPEVSLKLLKGVPELKDRAADEANAPLAPLV